MKINALAPWFGANRIGAARVGELLAGCEWIGVPFMGGGSELLHLQARTVVANDKHRDVVNLARVLADPVAGPRLYRRLRRLPFHEAELSAAQESLGRLPVPVPGEHGCCAERAAAYFVTCWMGRSGQAGTDAERRGGLAVRWTASGGDSAVRYRSAVKAMVGFRRALARVSFLCMDAFDFLDACSDRPGHGIYCDPPWPDAGEKYIHAFDEGQHRRLASVLGRFERARVVVRYGDHPLIRELYSAPCWRQHSLTTRNQANGGVPELLLVLNGPAAV